MIYSKKQARGDFGGASHWISATAWQMHPLSLRQLPRWGCTCQQKLDTKLKKLGIKIEYLYKAQ